MLHRWGARHKRLGRASAALAALSLLLWVLVPTAAEAKKHEVVIPGLSFVPANLTIGVGDQVEWNNTSGVAHTVTWHDEGPADLAMGVGEKKDLTFAAPGTYGYHCNFHSVMTGSVTVSAAQPSPSPSPPPSPSPSPSVRAVIPPPSPSPPPPPSPSPPPSPAPSPSPSPTTPPSPTTSPSPSPGETISVETTSGDGASLPLIIGIIGLLVALGAGGGLLYLRRKAGVAPLGGPPKRPPV
jgi:plastocyanin